MSKQVVVATLDLAKSNEDGSYSAEFSQPLNVRTSERLFVALQEINLEMCVQNFTREKIRYYFRNHGQQNWTAVDNCGVVYCVENIQLAVKLL